MFSGWTHSGRPAWSPRPAFGGAAGRFGAGGYRHERSFQSQEARSASTPRLTCQRKHRRTRARLTLDKLEREMAGTRATGASPAHSVGRQCTAQRSARVSAGSCLLEIREPLVRVIESPLAADDERTALIVQDTLAAGGRASDPRTRAGSTF